MSQIHYTTTTQFKHLTETERLDVSMKLCELYNIRIDELCGTQENVNHQYNNILTILMENWWKLLAMFSVLAYLINSLNKI